MSLSVWRIAWNGALDLQTLANGSLLADGRWHVASLRLPIVYCGSSRALCQLEKRVHCNGFAPRDMALLRLKLPANCDLEHAQNLGLLPTWRFDEAHTRNLGAAWAMAGKSIGLWVPSYIEPAECNLLLNPRHPQFASIEVTI